MVTDVQLHSRQWGCGERVAVLLHGMMADSGSWWQVGPALAERGYRVIAVDLPGHGHSPRSSQATVQSFVSWLLESVATGPELAIGHSMGGSILAACVERLRPQRAVYVDVPFVNTRTVPVDAAALTAERESDKASRTLDSLRANRPWWSEQDRIAEVESAKLWDVATAVSLSLDAAGRDLTPTTAIPSLMVRADPSEYVTPQDVERLKARGFEVRSVAGAGHSVWYGYFEEFMKTLDDWI
jgi:pimeloyl-ACP methyl ester carboxylesterase